MVPSESITWARALSATNAVIIQIACVATQVVNTPHTWDGYADNLLYKLCNNDT